MNIICDLDGTIADDTHRAEEFLRPYEPTERKWPEYFAACGGDKPHKGVIELLQTFWDAHKHEIYILSGRSMSASEETLKWLKENKVRYHYLQMRAIDDRTQDNQLKIKWARDLALTPANTLFVLEDRRRVVEAWRSAGFTVFQVADANF